ncbi:MAG: hypothetical protein ACYTBZ_26835 [Planctomycetota bacterium]|jgi:hypothetical protein
MIRLSGEKKVSGVKSRTLSPLYIWDDYDYLGTQYLGIKGFKSDSHLSIWYYIAYVYIKSSGVKSFDQMAIRPHVISLFISRTYAARRSWSTHQYRADYLIPNRIYTRFSKAVQLQRSYLISGAPKGGVSVYNDICRACNGNQMGRKQADLGTLKGTLCSYYSNRLISHGAILLRANIYRLTQVTEFTMPSNITQEAITMSLIAKMTGYPLHRVKYIVRSRRIRPHMKAGKVFVFSPSQMEFIHKELVKAEADPRGTNAGRPPNNVE